MNYLMDLKSTLVRHDVTPVEDGALNISPFLGDYFIRKAMWASKEAIKEYIASFTKILYIS